MNDNLRHHLTFVATGAEMLSRHTKALRFKPPFKTAAQDELLDAEQELEKALRLVRAAMAEYDQKEIAV
jgi:hypothetical protein